MRLRAAALAALLVLVPATAASAKAKPKAKHPAAVKAAQPAPTTTCLMPNSYNLFTGGVGCPR